jgi:hypothetical protein
MNSGSISISPIAGFAASVWMTRSRTIRPFPRTGTGAFARAIAAPSVRNRRRALHGRRVGRSRWVRRRRQLDCRLPKNSARLRAMNGSRRGAQAPCLLCLCHQLSDRYRGVIVDVEATRAIRQAEVGAARMLERTEDRFGLKPDYLTADSAYGSAESLAWLVKQKKDHTAHSRLRQVRPDGWDVLGSSGGCPAITRRPKRLPQVR